MLPTVNGGGVGQGVHNYKQLVPAPRAIARRVDKQLSHCYKSAAHWNCLFCASLCLCHLRYPTTCKTRGETRGKHRKVKKIPASMSIRLQAKDGGSGGSSKESRVREKKVPKTDYYCETDNAKKMVDLVTRASADLFRSVAATQLIAESPIRKAAASRIKFSVLDGQRQLIFSTDFHEANYKR